MNEEILDKLNAFCKLLNNEYDINSGGCCYVAHLLARELEKRHIKYKFAAGVIDTFFRKGDTIQVRRNIKNGNRLDSNVSASVKDHLFIIVDGKPINQGIARRYKSISYVNSNDILNAYNNNSWNDFYDHDKNIYISELIKIKFKELYENRRR